jgi:hypothetical protein
MTGFSDIQQLYSIATAYEKIGRRKKAAEYHSFVVLVDQQNTREQYGEDEDKESNYVFNEKTKRLTISKCARDQMSTDVDVTSLARKQRLPTEVAKSLMWLARWEIGLRKRKENEKVTEGQQNLEDGGNDKMDVVEVADDGDATLANFIIREVALRNPEIQI